MRFSFILFILGVLVLSLVNANSSFRNLAETQCYSTRAKCDSSPNAKIKCCNTSLKCLYVGQNHGFYKCR